MSTDTLPVADLRAAIGLVVDAFELEHGDQIPIEYDHYWHIPVDASFDLSTQPSECTVGQLTDDLEEVRRVLATEDGSPSWHGLAHIIGLLRVAERVSVPPR